MITVDLLYARETAAVKAQLDELVIDRGTVDDETPDWVSRSQPAWRSRRGRPAELKARGAR